MQPPTEQKTTAGFLPHLKKYKNLFSFMLILILFKIFVILLNNEFANKICYVGIPRGICSIPGRIVELHNPAL